MSDVDTELQAKHLITFQGEGSLKGFCDLAVGSLFLIKGLRIMNGPRGVFVSMPRHKGKDGKWYDSVQPLTKEVRTKVGHVVLDAYQQDAASNHDA